jgi:endonuclease YncB( thermonuclease family)
LAGIDAAELDHEHGVHQPGAQLAWERIQELVPAGTKIRVETIGNQPMRGNRQPVYMYYTDAEGKEVCLNEVLLDEGLCRPTNIEPYHPKIESFINKFVEAAYNRHGLWNEKFNPVKAPSLISLSKTVEPTPDGGQKTEFAIN